VQFTVSQRFFFDAAHTLKQAIEAEHRHRIHGHTCHAKVWLARVRIWHEAVGNASTLEISP
jgi:6-pyruvoyltetrahydropterin/6-carboxytetrahydropterin synthase